jgi:hypothetical protein
MCSKPLKLLCLVLLCLSVLATQSIEAGELVEPKADAVDDKIAWFDAQQIGVEGKGFRDTKAPFDRLPARAEKLVRGSVWGLSRQSAGLCVRFETDATELHAKWSLTSARLEMNHMPATGVSGLDLYVKMETGQWRWLAVGRPTAQSNSVRLVGGIPAGRREYIVYFPLYNGVTAVSIGIAKTAKLWKPNARTSGLKPIVFYGTSITQGGCASRPGMVHTAILGRWLDAPVINLGFSGNGRMENEVASLMGEIDASVYVLDCLPNISANDVKSRTEPVIKILRAAHPETPIVLVEDREYTDSFLIKSKAERNRTSRVELKAVYDKLKAAGVKQLYYIEGKHLLGDDGEGTVDSSHPTDLGFVRQSEAFRKVLKPILDEQRRSR